MRALRAVAAVACGLAAASVVAASPEVVGHFLADDGTIDNPRILLPLRVMQVAGALIGAASLGVAIAPELARRLVPRPRTAALTLGIGGGAAAMVGASTFVVKNQVSPLAHLEPSHPLAQEIAAATDPWVTWHAALLARDWPLVPPQQLWRPEGDAFARAWRAGDWRVGFGLEFPIQSGFRWWTTPTYELSFAQQAQTFLFDLLAADAAEPDDARLAAGLDVVRGWYRHNPAWPEIHVYQWNDGAMASRLDAHLLLADRARRRGLLTAADEPLWLGMVVQHAAMLLDPDRHQPVTNHGLMQDVALLDVAIAHPELDLGGEWRRTADERLAAYVDRAVAPSGAFRELTTTYHHYASERLIGAAAVARADGHPLPRETEDRIRAMFEVSRWLVQPDGSMPLIADSSSQPLTLGWPDLRLDWPELTGFRAAVDGQGPVGVRRFEPGYFVLRGEAGSGPWELVAMHGDASIAHEHRDKLSFTLFAAGSAAVRGPGYANEFDTAQASSVRQTSSQSTVVFDGKDQDLGPAPIRLERVWGSPDTPQAVAFSAVSELVGGTRHRRTWLWGPAADALLVVDDVSGSFTTATAQLGLGPDLTGDGPRYPLRHGALRVDAWVDGAPVTPRRSGAMSVVTLDHPGRIVTRLSFGDGGDTVEGERWSGPRGALTLGDDPAWTPVVATP